MSKNPFESMVSIMDVNELIDAAFSRGTSKSASIPKFAPAIMKAKRNEVKRIQNVNSYLLNRIKKIIQSFPNLDKLHPFYDELSHLLVAKDDLKNYLGKLNGLIPVLQQLVSEIIRKINLQDSSKKCAKMRMQYFGRTSSILKKQKNTFEFLETARKKLRSIPTLDTSLPSIVVAGYPNVGKSSLVSFLSTAKPEICEYPFTTKEIIIGVHRNPSNIKLFQIIDTPGVLDRPMSKRNEIEKQSILALRTISNILLFIFDPTLSCGYSIDNQIALFIEIKNQFIEKVNLPYLILLNKEDFATPEENNYVIEKLELQPEQYLKTNAKEGTNVDILVEKITKIIMEKGFFSIKRG